MCMANRPPTDHQPTTDRSRPAIESLSVSCVAAAIVVDRTDPAVCTLSYSITALLLALVALITLSSECVAWLLLRRCSWYCGTDVGTGIYCLHCRSCLSCCLHFMSVLYRMRIKNNERLYLQSRGTHHSHSSALRSVSSSRSPPTPDSSM